MKAPATSGGGLPITLVIMVHGIRGHAGVALEHARCIAASGRFDDVRVACQRGRPDLVDVVGDLVGRHVVLAPLLMAKGYTFKVMLDRLEPFRRRLASLTVAEPLGLHPGLSGLITTIAHRICAERHWSPVETGLIVAAHGTQRDPGSGQGACGHVAHIKKHPTFASVDAGFLDQPPCLAEVVAAGKARHHVAVGLFIDRGEHGEEDIPHILRGIDPQAAYSGPVGVDPAMGQLLIEQIDAVVV